MSIKENETYMVLACGILTFALWGIVLSLLRIIEKQERESALFRIIPYL